MREATASREGPRDAGHRAPGLRASDPAGRGRRAGMTSPVATPPRSESKSRPGEISDHRRAQSVRACRLSLA
jgi:hypothetical protein